MGFIDLVWLGAEPEFFRSKSLDEASASIHHAKRFRSRPSCPSFCPSLGLS